jgi:hypothetical protein
MRFDVIRNPTAGRLARQVTEAFPWDTAPRYLLRDRDSSYSKDFRTQVDAMGITEVVSAARSPWQNAYVERESWFFSLMGYPTLEAIVKTHRPRDQTGLTRSVCHTGPPMNIGACDRTKVGASPSSIQTWESGGCFPRCRSGAVGSIPSLIRSGRPSASFAANSAWEISSTALRPNWSACSLA